MAGTVQTWVNLLAFLLQAFVVSRIFKYIGVRGALFILPIIALGGYTLIALLPMFGVIRWTKVLENGTDYSIQQHDTPRALPADQPCRQVQGQAGDRFVLRPRRRSAAGGGGVRRRAAGVRASEAIALINLVLVAVWLVIVVAIAREHKKLVPAEAVKDAA